MTDFASLGLQIDSTQVKQGVGELDKLTNAGGRAEGSMQNLGSEASRAGAQVKGAAANAAALAFQAQASARAAVGMSAGLGTVARTSTLAAYQAQNLAFQINDVVTGIASGQAPMRVFAQQGGQFFQIMQQSGLGAKGFATALLEMIGVLKVTRDAELAEQAANASAAAQAVKGAATRASANIAAADTELALAVAAREVATTSVAEAAAQARVAAAHQAVATAAAEAAVAEQALATAQGRAATASAASAAKTVVSIGRMGVALGGLGIAAGVGLAAFKSFQNQVKGSGELDKFAEGLRLTDAQIEAAGGKVKYLGDRTREITGLTVTFGDVANATFQVLAERAGLTAKSISEGFTSAFATIGNFGKFTIAILLAGFASLIALIASLGVNLGKIATGKFDQLTNPLKDMKGQFFKTFSDVNAGFDKIGQRAIDLTKKRLQEESDANKPPKAKKPKKESDHGLADALAELDAQIKGQNALAAAYQVSDAAAIKAEAQQKAEEQAIRHKGAVALFYEKELALAVAKRAADGGKVIADIHAEAAARSVVNDLVEQGIIPVQRMGQALEEQQKKRQLMAALAVAEDQGWAKQAEALRGIIARLSHDQGVLNEEIAKEAALRQIASNKDETDRLNLEIKLIGASNQVRAVRLAQLQAEQYIRDNAITDPTQKADVTNSYVDAATAAASLTTAQDAYNLSLSATADLLGLINDSAQNLAGSLSDAFGGIGEGIGQAITALTGYAATQAKIDEDHRAAQLKYKDDAKALATVEILYAKQSSNAKQQATMQALSGLKSLFKEHSTGYKVMTAIEKAYAIFQAVQSAIAIARDIAHTASSLANSGVRTAANTAEGGSKIFAQLGWFAFPVVAAMVAVLASLGAKGHGGGASVAPTSAEDLQGAAGTGTVLGSPKDKSASIANSLELIAANTNSDLEYSNAMLKSLRSIDLSIGRLAANVAKQINVAGSLFDTSGLRLGSSGSSGFLGLFSSSTTRTLFDSGIQLAATTVGNIIASGIAGNTYQIVEQIKKKSGFLGIGGGTKTSYVTTTGGLPADITGAVQDVIVALRNGLVEAAHAVGVQGAEAIINGFTVSIGTVSFKDLSGQEIEDQLNAIFSSIGDQMAKAVFPELQLLQQLGEGLFETFVRVAKEYESVDVALKSIGRTFGAVGVNSIAARDALVQLFGGLDDFISATDAFRSNFLSEAEQIAPIQQAVVAEMVRLGVANVTTRDQFKNLVLGLDLTTDAGRQMYASLLSVAPAFDKVLDYFDQLNKTDTSGLQSTVEQFTKFADSLKVYRATLFATGFTQATATSVLRARFISTAALAAQGNATALGGLQDAGKSYLDSVKATARTEIEYRRAIAQVAAGVDKGIFAAESTADYAQLQLNALKNATSILQAIDANTAAAVDALLHPPPVPPPVATPAPAPAPAPTTDPEVVDQLADIGTALTQVAVNTGGMLRMLRSFDNGGSLRISNDPDDGLTVLP